MGTATFGGPHRRSTEVRDEDLLEFELRWFEHGGGPAEEIAVAFGMTPQEFFGRILAFVEHNPPAPYRATVVEAIKSVARKRLWLVG
jgi:hypothetical protein